MVPILHTRSPLGGGCALLCSDRRHNAAKEIGRALQDIDLEAWTRFHFVPTNRRVNSKQRAHFKSRISDVTHIASIAGERAVAESVAALVI
jgi:hypothetical protein